MSKFVKFPSIDNFHSLRRNMSKKKTYVPSIMYRAKIKLHGTNAGINMFTDKRILPQSKNHFISTANDNCGFAQWLEDNIQFFSKFTDLITDKPITIFGEWCGKTIMANAAICSIPTKIYAVYAIQIGLDDDSEIIFEPDEITSWLGQFEPIPPDIFVLPWYNDAISIPFMDKNEMTLLIDEINKMVDDVEQCDPFVKEHFGIEGTGEGLVFYPINYNNRQKWSEYMFKAKGKEHRVQKERRAVVMDAEQINSIDEFVNKFLTEQRCMQAVYELNNNMYVIDRNQLNNFVKWISIDIHKESKCEVEENNMNWKQISPVLALAAQQWFLKKVNE